MREWLKLIVLILLPINAWLGAFFYLHWQKQKFLMECRQNELKGREAVSRFIREMVGFKEGQTISFPFPYHATVLGINPPVGKGLPVLFLNISTRADKEIFDPTIREALATSPYLHVVLVHEIRRVIGDPSKIQKLVRDYNHPRLSVLIGEEWVRGVFGNGFVEEGAILLILCDGKGIIRAIEPYPELKLSSSWDENVKDWRPKLHRAVKKVLDEFFPKGQGR